MLFTPTFVALFAAISGFATRVSAAPTTDGVRIMSESEILTWLSTTDAELTFIGEPIPKQGGPGKLAGGNVMVIYCSTVVGSLCGGPCTVYNGGATCLQAPDTNCLSASTSVGYCNDTACGRSGGACNQLSQCGIPISDGFCYTPGTKSILVPFI